MRKDKSVYLVSLGCNKNTVDSEIILTLLKKHGYTVCKEPKEASHIIVNTCAFIDEAKEESIDTILTLSEFKKNGARLYVTGCFTQLYYKEILKEIPEVDAMFGVGDLTTIANAIDEQTPRKVYEESLNITSYYREYTHRQEFITPKSFSYCKVSEGCNRKCSYCLIPKIKGPYRSRLPESIVDEVIELEEKGIQEIILTSQDTLSYGKDLVPSYSLPRLIESLLLSTHMSFIRFLYLRPSEDLLKLLDFFQNSRLIPYFDIPIQHASNMILRAMRREGDLHLYKRILTSIRERIPQAVIRTTLIVGFPGEDEKAYRELEDFISEGYFNHVGVFVFSPQENTEAYRLRPRVPRKVAEGRKRRLMEVQREISKQYLESEVGKSFQVLVEEEVEEEKLYFGRSFHFAPEVDGVFVLHTNRKLPLNKIVTSHVIRADDYDLHGEVI